MEELKDPKSIEETTPKKKKKKTGIMYEDKLYVPVDRKKYKVKNILNMDFYSRQCKEYLVTSYEMLSEKIVDEMLENNILVLHPNWFRSDLTAIKGNKLFRDIQSNTSDYKVSRIFNNFRFPKYAQMYTSIETVMNNTREKMIGPGSELYKKKVLSCITHVLNSPLTTKTLIFNRGFCKEKLIYSLSCAEFSELSLGNYPYLAVKSHIDGDPLSSVGILFKMPGLCDSNMIFISCVSDCTNMDFEEFLTKISERKIGKIVGKEIYIPPYERFGFLLDPETLEEYMRYEEYYVKEEINYE